MPSPFPGMNPFLENRDIWVDFHARFITQMAETLSAALRPNYLVKIEQRVYIHELPSDQWRPIGRSDVSVHRPIVSTGPAGTSVLTSPAEIEMLDTLDRITSRYLEIVDRTRREVVTVFELLSPSNKTPGPDRDQYIDKRLRIFSSDVNLVEIDLLRGGPRPPLGANPPECDYYVLVSRPANRPRMNIWPIGLREPLPAIPVPVSNGAIGAMLDLQQTLNVVYDSSTYDLEIYSQRPEPDLTPVDDAWARQFIPAIVP